MAAVVPFRTEDFYVFSDVIMGNPYTLQYRLVDPTPERPRFCGRTLPDYIRTLQNDEHIIFNPDYQRIRYLIEADIV